MNRMCNPATAQRRLEELVAEVANELTKARAKHAPMHGPHEGYAVILEELDELWDEVRAQQQDPAKMRKEALHVAAMALRFIADVCDHALNPACLAEGHDD
jgi:hypothetical protein